MKRLINTPAEKVFRTYGSTGINNTSSEKFFSKYRSGIRLLFLSLLTLISFTLLSASPFRVLQITESEIVLEFSLPDYQLQPVEQEGITYHRITGEITSYHQEEGYPELPFFSENVGIPVDGSIELIVDKVRQKNISDIIVYPVEELVVNDYDVDQIFYRDRVAYNSNENYPAQIISPGVTAFAGDRRFASFIFNPFRFNARNKQLSVISQATITIRILGDKTVTRDYLPGRNYIDKAGELFFLNNEYSQHWRKPRDYEPDHSQLRSFGNSEIQLIVDKEGIYKVTYEDLADTLTVWQQEYEYLMDFDIDTLDPRFLQLESKDGVVPIHFSGERNGSFDPGDYFEFYGDRNYGKTGYYDSYTAENVYTLKLVDQYGARMSVENGGIKESNPRNYILPVSYEHEVHFEQQNNQFSLGNYNDPPREDLWFWKTIAAPDLNVTSFNLEHPHQTHLRSFSATVCLTGLTYLRDSNIPDHRARVRINSSFINDHTWFGQSNQLFTNASPLPNTYLQHGENFLYIDLPGTTPSGNEERILLDYFQITYWREYKTDSDYIRFKRPSNRPLGLYQFELDNFSNGQISVYKINSGIIENLQIEPFSETGGAPYKVTFQNDVVAHNIEFVAITDEQKKIPKDIRPRFPSDLKNPYNSADYIIITVRDFMEDEGTQLFKTTWENRGYLVEIVDVQNIFDEFNYGIRSADAIKDFLSYVYHNWSMPMTHVLLLGKGLSDERDHSVDRNTNLIPFKNIWTARVGATPSDNWYACIIGDDPVPDFNISRITLWNTEQILPVAQKTVHYLENPNFNTPWQSTVTLASGGKITDNTDVFAKNSETIRKAWIPEDYNVIRVYTNTQTVSEQYLGGTFKLKNTWDAGSLLVQFYGHGGGRIWADYNLLNNNDISTLNNDNYPFVISLSCYPSDFSRPGSSSIGETMVLSANRGAIAHLGTSGLSYTNANVSIATHITEAIFHRSLSNFGDIVSFTRAKTYSTVAGSPLIASTHGSVMFGDPMLDFVLPQERVQIELDKYNVTEGDTISISIDMPEDILLARYLVQNQNEITLNIPFDSPVVNGVFSADYVVPETPQNNYKRLIKVYGYGQDRQIIGMTSFSVGQAAVVDVATIPENITAVDSVHITARFFAESGISSVICRRGTTLEHPMIYDSENHRYITENPFPPSEPSTNAIEYYFEITTGDDQLITEGPFNYRVLAPDLTVYYLEFSSIDNNPAIKLQIKNIGEISSPPTSIRLTKVIGEEETFLNEITVPEMEAMDSAWHYIPFEPLQGTLRFRARINPDNQFAEHAQGSNSLLSPFYNLNMFQAGVEAVSVSSLDGNLFCEIPAGLFSEEAVFYINSSSFYEPLNQPDINTLSLANNQFSYTYQIGTFNETALIDTLGTLPNDKKIRLTLKYNPEDTDIIDWESEDSFALYRWEADYQKWINQGGFTSTAENFVYQDVSRLSTYTILRNNDKEPPVINANVQEQEFTFGGYISGTGIISFTLSDANGIDIFDQGIDMFLNGVPVEEKDFTIAANPANLTSVPIKHQLNLDAGNYTLSISCSDVNGNFQSHDINFIVNKTFDVINLANYPNPIVATTIDPANQNRTRFTYVLTDDADDVTIKIYTVSGRLVKTFNDLPKAVGYHEFPRTVLGWDCRDETGIFLANGVYFYKIIARKGNKTIERIQKMAVAR
jgi:hypothetical protein